MPADHACRTITGADEMKLNEMNEMSVEKWWNEICGRENREKPQEKSTQTPFRPPRNPHGVTETWIWDPRGERWVSNCLCNWAILILSLSSFKHMVCKGLGCFVFYIYCIYIGYFFQGPIGHDIKTTVKIRNILFATFSHTYQLLLYIVDAPT